MVECRSPKAMMYVQIVQLMKGVLPLNAQKLRLSGLLIRYEAASSALSTVYGEAIVLQEEVISCIR